MKPDQRELHRQLLRVEAAINFYEHDRKNGRNPRQVADAGSLQHFKNILDDGEPLTEREQGIVERIIDAFRTRAQKPEGEKQC